MNIGKQIVFICCSILLPLLAGAHELSLDELANVPESVEINGQILTGIAYPYYNLEPRSVPAQPVDCKQNGTFIVTVNIHVKDGLLLKQTSAERLWVIQGKKNV